MAPSSISPRFISLAESGSAHAVIVAGVSGDPFIISARKQLACPWGKMRGCRAGELRKDFFPQKQPWFFDQGCNFCGCVSFQL
jgi:hypothetical protein